MLSMGVEYEYLILLAKSDSRKGDIDSAMGLLSK